MQETSIEERKNLVIPKVKKMADYTLSRLEMTGEDDQKMIDVVR